MDDTQRNLVGGLGIGLVLGGIAWLGYFPTESAAIRIAPAVAMGLVGFVMFALAYRSPSESEAVARLTQELAELRSEVESMKDLAYVESGEAIYEVEGNPGFIWSLRYLIRGTCGVLDDLRRKRHGQNDN
jgi:hypothetical protein